MDKTKLSLDVAAVATAWAHFIGFWQDNVGIIAATLSVVWLGIQLGEWIYKKYKGT